MVGREKWNICVFVHFWFVKLNKFWEILVFAFNKYGYELCTCINMEINTCAKKIKYAFTKHYLYYIGTNTSSKII